MRYQQIVTGHALSTNCKVSPIPAGRLKILLVLTFSVEQKQIHKMMKDFVENSYY